MEGHEWVQFTKRTNDPKLRHLESLLRDSNIPSRRKGWSYHAPILQVKARDLSEAWDLLSEDVFGDGRMYDDIPDHDPVFQTRRV